jgi:transposase
VDIIIACCAGLDIHKKTVVACVRDFKEIGQPIKEQVRAFATTTRALRELRDWLVSLGVTHVAMESTGVFWRPIWNILQDSSLELLLVNARHIKNVPGRKTDVKDCQWISHLLQIGLLKASFVPPAQQRQWRELCRHRTQLTGQTTQVINRIQKVLQDANIKLSSVASDIVGVSGRTILRAMIAGERDPEILADLAKGRLRAKIQALKEALEGRLTEHHQFLLGTLMDQLAQLEGNIQKVQDRIDQEMQGVEEQIKLLDTIPGVNRLLAQTLLAEVGPDMSHFPSAQHLSSWAGMCPGNHESAGKRKSGRINPGNRWLRRSLVQAGWAASHTKDTYLSVQYQRLAKRRGKKRALIAVGHTILEGMYAMFKKNEPWQELGANWFDQLRPERITRNLVKRLEKLGYQVSLTHAA